MRYNNHTSACCRRSVSALIAGGVVLVPTSLAYAETLDDLVGTVTSSTELTFGTGAAAGAVAAGLLGVIVHARSKRRYKKQVEGLQNDLASARESQAAAEARLKELGEDVETFGQGADEDNLYTDVSADAESVGDSTSDDMSSMPTEVLQAITEQDETPEQAASDSGEDEAPQTEDEPFATESTSHVAVEVTDAVEAEASAVVEEEPRAEEETSAEDAIHDAEDPASVSFASHKTVRAILEERLTPDALNEGIGRYGVASSRAGIPAFLGHRRTRQYDPVVRASLIDQRVPRFDESLFPDVVTHVHDEVDVFETAMRAMEDTLQHTAVLGIEEEDPSVYEQSESNNDSLDVAAYVEYLLQDELEKTMSGEPLTTNHPHLTMFEGTGDLNASKDLGKHSPDHMRMANSES